VLKVMSETSRIAAPTSETDGRETDPISYPAGIAARILIMSCSRLSRDAGLLL
jgi:hypothetical protein